MSEREYILNLNDKCNNRCRICFEGERMRNRQPISEAEVGKELREAKKLGYTRVDFFGGEPTVHPFLFSSMALAKKLGFRLSLGTNARMFCDKNYARRFKSLDIDLVRTSLHGPDAKTHDRLTQVKGSFAQTIAGIKNMVGLGMPVLVNIVITKNNYRDLPKMASMMMKLGVKRVKFSGLLIEGSCLESRDLVVSYSKIKKPLLGAMESVLKNEAVFFWEKLPVCLALFFGSVFLTERGQISQSAEKCRRCEWFGKCAGVDMRHLEILPGDEKSIGCFYKKGSPLNPREIK